MTELAHKPERPKLRVAVAAHGRFHAFDLARETIRLNESVTVFTNYPSQLGPRFGIHPAHMRTLVSHGLLTRAWDWLGGGRVAGFRDTADRHFHEAFGRWLARELSSSEFDAIHIFSGIAEETLGLNKGWLKTLVRGSSHIQAQLSLLQEEERRVGAAVDKPSNWMVAREMREYSAAQLIFVLSSFAKQTFVEAGVPEQRLRLLPLGTQISRFRATDAAIAARIARIRSPAKLRVLFVGTFCARKGTLDFAAVAKRLHGKMAFRVVGPMSRDAKRIAEDLASIVEFRGPVSHYDLPSEYAWGDVFFFPTIEDGYAVVLAQAQGSGLPILATTNCAAPDIVEPDRTGWITPIRAADQMIHRLDWGNSHRSELAEVAYQVRQIGRPRDWSKAAAEFIQTLRLSINASAY